MGLDPCGLSDEEIQAIVADWGRRFVEEAPTTALEAATIILDGVKACCTFQYSVSPKAPTSGRPSDAARRSY